MVARQGSSVSDHVALVEIDLYGELMIAASSVDAERMSAAHIDAVLRVHVDRSNPATSEPAPEAARDPGPEPLPERGQGVGHRPP
ncbi:hypothetical protein ACMA1D_27200 [Streptomyces sp. 796.1]|uniref:hypothetical protein n=1 Tax=Streptomyces sp. 796.1 TaxID=3163029 RepID=UPI0039C94B30